MSCGLRLKPQTRARAGSHLSAASSIPLRGWALYLTVRAEDAAIPLYGHHRDASCPALIEVLARVLGHDLAALRTPDRRPKLRHVRRKASITFLDCPAKRFWQERSIRRRTRSARSGPCRKAVVGDYASCRSAIANQVRLVLPHRATKSRTLTLFLTRPAPEPAPEKTQTHE